MDAHAKAFTFLGNEGQVSIPFFQRPYVWDEANWSELLADLSNADRRHFLGSLILKQERAATGEPKRVTVIDGQQRLTTLSVLLKAIYDSLPIDIRENCKDAVRTHLFFKRNQTDRNYLVRIQHSHVDATAYSAVIKAGLDGPAFDMGTGSQNRIIRCYRYYRCELEKRPEADLIELFERILHPQEKMLVVIDLLEDDDEQTIFDTTNTAGVRLSGADVIKNALFQSLIQLVGDDKQLVVDVYKRTWERVFLFDDDALRFWEAEKPTGRLMRDNSDVLLHALAVIGGFFDPDKHQLSDLPRLYKERIRRYKSAEELVSFVEEITRYADLYRDTIPEFRKDTLLSFSDPITRLFHVLDVLQISTFHPFVLFILHEHRSDQIRRDAILSSLERFVIRRVLAQHETKNFNKIARAFIADPQALAAEAKLTTDGDVVAGIRKISNKHAALVLFWIELRRRSRDHKYDITELKYDYSLEHIMPQKWEQHWGEIPDKRDASGGVMSRDDAKKDRHDKVYWLGNMTLLTSELNSSLRNFAFQKKVAGDGRKKGIKAYGLLSITHDDIVEPYERGETVWDESRIVKRTDALARELLSIWCESV